jgi:two-component system sensor histidine kinase KdpD
VVDQLIHNSGTIDIYVISSSDAPKKRLVEVETLLPAAPPHGFISSFALVAVITVVGLLVKSIISPTNLMMLYVLAVVVAAYQWGMRPAIFTAVIGILAFDFVFIPPYFSFRVSDIEYLITFAGLIGVGALISLLVARVREHALAAQSRENETSTLYALSQELASAVDTGSIISIVGKHIDEIFKWQCAFLLPEADQLVERGGSIGLTLDADEHAVAFWAFRHGTVAGYDTDTLHDSRLRFIPLQTSRGTLGIMGVKPLEPNGVITPEQTRILTAFANQAALAFERVSLAQKAG